MSLKPYEILGLSENYNLYDAKSAFYAYSRQYHPDTSNCNFLTKEEKETMFHVIETAYKQILAEKQICEIDAPMFTQYEYDPAICIEKNNDLTTLEKFNTMFEKVHAEENYDNPWSIHYNLNTTSTNHLDILRPTEFKKNYYYEYGINTCSDFSRPGQYTDINYTSDNLDNIELESTDINTLLEMRDKIDYSPEITLQEEYKQRILKQIEEDKKQVQLERDIRILKLN